MIDKVCKILKGVFVTGWLCAQITQIQASTYYSSPSGSGSTCSLASPCSFDSGIFKLSSGDTLNVLAGTYTNTGGGIVIRNHAYASETIIQANGWTSPGARTQDYVVVDGANTSATWTQCSGTTNACNNPCGIVGPGPCNQYWYIVGASTYIAPVAAKDSDGSSTYMVNSASDMTNSHTNFVSGRCTTDTWRACHSSWDCDTGQTCTSGAASEHDSYTTSPGDGLAGTLYVRWGTSVPSGAYIVNNQGGFASGAGIYIENSTNVTIRGFIVRNTAKPALQAQINSSNIKFIDNHVAYVCNSGGNDYAAVFATSTNITFDHNELMASCSEALHTNSYANPATAAVYTITNNWIHLVSDDGIQGPRVTGTPQGVIITDDYTGGGNYTGSIFDGNFIDFSTTLQNNLTGLRLEDKVTGIRISNNIFNKTTGAGLLFATEGNGVTNVDVYANIFNDCGKNVTNSYERADISFVAGSAANTNNNIFNNTLVMTGGTAALYNDGTPDTGNIIRNNIIVTPDNTKAISWAPTSTTNKFDHNLIYSLEVPIASIGGTLYPSCVELNAATSFAGNNICQDPGFYDPANYLFYPTGGSFSNPSQFLTNSQFGGPAIDMGTSTGNPAAHTTGIVNTLAAQHGFGFYSDSIAKTGSTWDAGAVEAIVTQQLSDWTVTAKCGGGAGTITDLVGQYRFANDSSLDTCSQMALTLPTLNANHIYLAAVRLNDMGADGGGGGCAGASMSSWNLEGIDPLAQPFYPGTIDATTGRLNGYVSYSNRVSGNLLTGLILYGNNNTTCLGPIEFYFTPVMIIP